MSTERLPTMLSLKKHTKEYCAQFDVFFNGVKQHRCIMADAALGVVHRYKYSVFGIPVRKGGRFETETLRGKVEIKRKVENDDATA